MASKRLKVFGIPWHTGHQHSLFKLPFFESYDLLINPYRTWGHSSRPLGEKAKLVPHYEKGKYDLAILHVDQQSLYDPEKGDRISKGRLYMEAREAIGDDVPIVTINHMTPFHDKYEEDYVVDFIKDITEGTHMVVNSYTAAKQWGWGYTITHGLEPDEWWDLPKEPRIVTVLSGAGMSKAYRRVFLTTVKRYLDEQEVPFFWVGGDIPFFKSWDEYRDFLGRSMVYFNPTWQSPRPRARTEAMFSGACIVTTRYQDADTFIKDGENGYLTSKFKIEDPRVMDNPKQTADLLAELIFERPDEALELGKEAKKTAMELFTFDKFEEQWRTFLSEEVGIL